MADTSRVRARLQARDVMTTPVVTVRPDATVKDIASLMLTHGISGLPVVTAYGELVGIITEADLLHRETGSERLDPGFGRGLPVFGRARLLARKAAGLTAADLMTSPVVTVEEGTLLHEVAALMLRREINRVPVKRAERLAGIISRHDVLRAFVRPDEDIARAVRETLLRDLWIDTSRLKIEVVQGVVYLAGCVETRADKVLAERWAATTDGVVKVESSLTFEFDDGRVAAGVKGGSGR